MTHYLTGDEKFAGYRFGRGHAKGGRGRSALNRLNGYFRSLIEGVADAKVRRMRDDPGLRNIGFYQPDKEWIPSSLRDRSRGE